MSSHVVTPRRKRFGAEKRKAARRTLGYPAKIDARDGTPLHACVLFDVSQTGAKLVAQTTCDIPDEFMLLLGQAFRKCRVVWRNDRQLGVTFLPTGAA
jgi:PilZ domain